MLRRVTLAALAGGMLACPALAQTPPTANIAAVKTQVDAGDDVQFTVTLDPSPTGATLVRARWGGHDRYWWLQPRFVFSFPCNATNRGRQTVTLMAPDETTNGSGSPTTYTVGSPPSATATCKATLLDR